MTKSVAAALIFLSAISALAQTAGRGGSSQAARPASPAARAAAPVSKPDATLLQLMRGVLYPASNVIFAAQDDLGKFTAPDDPSTSPNPITSTYGGWNAVENASMALAESTRLISVPGRACSNGKIAPVQRADWKKYVEGLRVAALKSYKAAQTKSTDAMLDAASDVSDACAMCHQVYREKPGGNQDRCLP
jgi:hypothetical protein